MSENVEKQNWIKEMIEREATPKAERTETVAEFAVSHSISDSTYNYQKNKKENKRLIVEIWLNEATDGGNEVLSKLKEKANAGDMKAIELYLKFVLKLAENLDITSRGEVIKGFNFIKNEPEKPNDKTITETGESVGDAPKPQD